MPWALVKILNDTNAETNPEETAMSFVSSLLSSLPTLQFCYYLSSESQPNFQISLYQRLHSSLDKKDIDSFVWKITSLRKSRLVNLGCFFTPCISFSRSVIFSFKNHSWALHGLRMKPVHLPRVLLPFCIVRKPDNKKPDKNRISCLFVRKTKFKVHCD